MSLAEKLKQIVEAAKERIPAETLGLMKKATQELRDSGISNGVLQEGAPLPPFELSNMNGELVSSTKLLEKGNLVLTFYRGVW
jgi:cytochrome oxidase Cu insertion factor (SCO1/SenC/PrrC family)